MFKSIITAGTMLVANFSQQPKPPKPDPQDLVESQRTPEETRDAIRKEIESYETPLPTLCLEDFMAKEKEINNQSQQALQYPHEKQASVWNKL